MKVLVAGAGENGVKLIKQLRKNPDIQILVLDPRDNPYAVEAGIIEAVDIKEVLTPLTLDHIVRAHAPALIFLTMDPEDMGLGSVSGVDILTDSLKTELSAISKVPIIDVARHRGR